MQQKRGRTAATEAAAAVSCRSKASSAVSPQQQSAAVGPQSAAALSGSSGRAGSITCSDISAGPQFSNIGLTRFKQGLVAAAACEEFARGQGVEGSAGAKCPYECHCVFAPCDAILRGLCAAVKQGPLTMVMLKVM